MTRIPFADPAGLTPEGRQFHGDSPAEIIRVLANATDSFVPWFGAVIGIRQSPDLDPALRELVVLRMASGVGCAFEVNAHRPTALAAGATPEQVDAACGGEEVAGPEGIVVSLVDDLFAGRAPGDERYAQALGLISPRALVEAIMIAGLYVTIGRLVEAAAL
jgi:AhpD family alkylhydroperoxidase